ncbi:hypothetical protein [Bacillus sp. FJAT-45350]|uniref:hypothetical protein n=1 Tax=Bacillus sp. FJAT-45350 TaxID=2011014 RepID=UPI0015C6AF83|nr:hypothetical protein [Bacillus sp. FJAT-45350]
MGDWNEQASRNNNQPRPVKTDKRELSDKMIQADIQEEISQDAKGMRQRSH